MNSRAESALGYIRTASAARPIGQNELANLLGCDMREVRRVVEALRLLGFPICSSRDRRRGGYWVGSEVELKIWQQTAKRGALAVLKTISRTRTNENQLPLWPEGGGHD